VSESLFYSNKNTPVLTTMSIRLYKNILNKGEWFIMKKMDKKEFVNANGGFAMHVGFDGKGSCFHAAGSGAFCGRK